MEYSDEYLREFLPREPPPFELVPDEVLDDIERWASTGEKGDALLMARSTQWTYAMFSELRLGRARFDVDVPIGWAPFLSNELIRSAAIGLFDYEATTHGFGLTYFSSPTDYYPAAFQAGEVRFDRLEKRFPVWFEQVFSEDHNLPHPANATSAAWARCNRSAQWGILTAGHAAGSRPGRKLPLADGSFGRVSRSFYPLIDAAFVQTVDEPSKATTLQVRSFPAAGHSVRIGCQSGPAERVIVKVDDNLGVVQTRAQPVLMYTDRCCSPGDSGALVRADGGAAVGLYLGGLKSVRVPSGVAGRVLSIEQAVFALEVTAYE